MSEFSQGLTISGFGILITFSALAILIGLIFLLKVIFPVKGKKATPQESEREDLPAPSLEREKLLKQAAGVGVSVLLAKMSRSDQGSLGKLLEAPAAGWWRQGLDRVQGKE